jgi:hypothetical protein
LPPLPLRLLPGGANQFPGRELHPLKSRAFHGALLRQLRRDELTVLPFPRALLNLRSLRVGCSSLSFRIMSGWVNHLA